MTDSIDDESDASESEPVAMLAETVPETPESIADAAEHVVNVHSGNSTFDATPVTLSGPLPREPADAGSDPIADINGYDDRGPPTVLPSSFVGMSIIVGTR